MSYRKELFGKPGNAKPIGKNTHIYFLPISWGISWHKIATVVVTPVSVEDENAAPITKPSAKLWRLSPTRTIIANKLIFLPQKRKTNKQIKSPVLTQTVIASFLMLQVIWGFRDFAYNITKSHNNHREVVFICFVLAITIPSIHLKQKI